MSGLFRPDVQVVTKTVTFDGTSGKGKVLGDSSDTVLFTTYPNDQARYDRGILVLRLDMIVLDSLVGAAGATLSILGEGYFFDAATDISLLTTGKIWTTTAATTGAKAIPATSKEIVVASGDPSIGALPEVHDITGGTVRMDIFYLPLGMGTIPI